MIIEKSYCSHCGKEFKATSTLVFYSVVVDNNGRLIKVLDGELIPDALHYCSDNCMFHRNEGVVPVEDFCRTTVWGTRVR